MVSYHDLFDAHPFVIKGCSDLFLEAFGATIGYHARSAIGVTTLPANIAVEIEEIVAVAWRSHVVARKA